MRIRRFVSLLSLALLVGLVAAVAATATPPTTSSGVVRSFADGSVIPGSSWSLSRTDNGYSFQLSSSQLPAGNAITDWMIVFNNPSACTHPALGHPCSPPDLHIFGGTGDVQDSIFYGTGRIISGNGAANWAGHVSAGRTNRQGNVEPEQQLLYGEGLTNPRGADVWMVVHDHGPAIPGLVDLQIHSFGYGCSNLPPFTGPNFCSDLQFAA